MTRVIVAGGRDGVGLPLLPEILEQFIDVQQDILLCGMAQGVDTDAYNWARARGCQIQEFHPNYPEFGTRAPLMRNLDMALRADVLVAFWDGKSTGTRDMIQKALNNGLEVHVYRYELA